MSYIFPTLFIVAAFCIIQIVRIDWRMRIIPDIYLFPFFLIGLLSADQLQWLGGVGDAVLSAAVGYLLGFIMYIVFKRIYKKDEPIGFGDVKLLAAGGAWLGLTLLPYAIVVAAILGAAWGLTRKQRFVPFAPFFFAGAIIALTIWCVF